MTTLAALNPRGAAAIESASAAAAPTTSDSDAFGEDDLGEGASDVVLVRRSVMEEVMPL